MGASGLGHQSGVTHAHRFGTRGIHAFHEGGMGRHESLLFNYRFTGTFCEGEGVLDLRLVPRPSGAWMFASDFCELEGHPEGQGQILFPSSFETNRLVLYIGEFSFVNKTWLDG